MAACGHGCKRGGSVRVRADPQAEFVANAEARGFPVSAPVEDHHREQSEAFQSQESILYCFVAALLAVTAML